jgi:hypothetical protein
MFQCADDAPDGASKMLAEVARFKTKVFFILFHINQSRLIR